MSERAPRLLIIDDDERLRDRLIRALRGRGIEVEGAEDAVSALKRAADFQPDYAVLDLRMPGEHGLQLLPRLLESLPNLRVLVLTGYGSIATAVSSVRAGAVDYLTKPADADQILAALGLGPTAGDAADSAAVAESDPTSVPSLERVEWEHIQRVMDDCGGNVSKAARTLGLHRRTLQRKLATLPPRR